MSNRISYLTHKDIDKTKWDACIQNASNCLVYGMSWYLDQVCEHWDGLVLGDYQAVMPLPWKSKYGLKYVIQPLFTKQLGIFGISDDNNINDFLKKIPVKFIYVNFSGNYQNHSDNRFPKMPDQVLDMSKFPDYNKSTRYNIRKSIKNQLVHEPGTVTQFLETYKKLGHNFINNQKIKLLDKLFHSVQFNSHSHFYTISDTNKEILSILWVLIFKNRGYLISSATTEKGKKKSAKFLAIHQFLENHSQQINEFDFVGSGIPGVYDFNRGFGAHETNFPVITFHLLNRSFK
ncbi:MAG: hypothetical protein GVY19_09785 [Bacteroidetes bacterium]|jgi:hypothetical protein|nr:hypothetical protein [Bacteroidota bacterium]